MNPIFQVNERVKFRTGPGHAIITRVIASTVPWAAHRYCYRYEDNHQEETGLNGYPETIFRKANDNAQRTDTARLNRFPRSIS